MNDPYATAPDTTRARGLAAVSSRDVATSKGMLGLVTQELQDQHKFTEAIRLRAESLADRLFGPQPQSPNVKINASPPEHLLGRLGEEANNLRTTLVRISDAVERLESL